MSAPTTETVAPAARTRIDPRGPRFAATLTTLVLAAALLLAPSAATVTLLAVQLVVFAVGAVGGVQRTPYSWLFRTLLRPRLGQPAELEDAAPPQFAQLVGLGFAAGGTLSFAVGASTAALILTGFALVAAVLNASIGLCLGCEVYLLFRRTKGVAA